jgi:hypothetical protein
MERDRPLNLGKVVSGWYTVIQAGPKWLSCNWRSLECLSERPVPWRHCTCRLDLHSGFKNQIEHPAVRLHDHVFNALHEPVSLRLLRSFNLKLVVMVVVGGKINTQVTCGVEELIPLHASRGYGIKFITFENVHLYFPYQHFLHL